MNKHELILVIGQSGAGRTTVIHILDDQGFDDFEALLDAGDDRIYAWVMGNAPVPEAFDTHVFRLIKSFKEE